MIWKRENIKDLTELFTDGDWIETKNQSVDGIRLIQTGNIGFGKFKPKEDKKRFISLNTFEKLKCKEIYPGDILTSRLPDPVGKSCIIPDVGERMITGVDCSIIRLKPHVDKVFFAYYQMSNEYLNEVNARVTGTTRSRISRKNLGQIKVPIPPLPEQKQIVETLDKAFEKIDKAIANIERNIQNAEEFFKSYLQNIFENKGQNWEEKTLGKVCKIIGGGTPSKKRKDFYEGNILWATVRDMKSEIIKNTQHKITTDAVKYSSTNIIPKGNVIIATRVGLGKVCLLEKDCAINQDLKAVIPKKDTMLSISFLFRWFTSISEKIINEGTGATVQGVKLTFINSLPISIPPIKEQKEIVIKLDALSIETKKLKAIYTQKIADLEELKKSILEKAFKGELTNTA